MPLPSAQAIRDQVAAALAEDVGAGDITAALLAARDTARATILCRQAGVVCGTAWVDEVFRQLDGRVAVSWALGDGAAVAAGSPLCQLQGPARSLLTGERTALNFLQLLSGIATRCRQHVDALGGANVRLLDTRKTLPGLRAAQKYAVTCGGGHNHRFGLFDAYLIKENHIAAHGSVAAAVAAAKERGAGFGPESDLGAGVRPGLEPGAGQEAELDREQGSGQEQRRPRPVTVEVETLAELDQALDAGADRVLLDNFSLDALRAAVQRNRDWVSGDSNNSDQSSLDQNDPDRNKSGRAELEASGGITLANLAAVAATGVDCISLGTLTKDVTALDLSMRLDTDTRE